MASPEDTNLRHRLRLLIVAIIVLTALATAMAGTLARNSAGALSRISAGSGSVRHHCHPIPGAPRTAAFDINNRGQIIGVYENPNAAPDRQLVPRADARTMTPSL